MKTRIVSAIVAFWFIWATAKALQVQSQTVRAPAPNFKFIDLEAAQNAANSKPGPRSLPPRVIPVPDTVSPELASAIAGPYRLPNWNANPKSAAEWKKLVADLAAATA